MVGKWNEHLRVCVILWVVIYGAFVCFRFFQYHKLIQMESIFQRRHKGLCYRNLSQVTVRLTII